jgi:Ni,Fe-hydrogenase III small subunit
VIRGCPPSPGAILSGLCALVEAHARPDTPSRVR